jgi:hypothetical protein
MSGEQDKLRVSLEPPKLFGRRRNPRAAGDAPQAPTPAAPDTTDVGGTAVEEASATELPPEPVPEPETPTSPEPAPERAASSNTQVATNGPARRPAEPALPVEPEPVSTADFEDAEIAAVANAEPLLPVYRAAAVTGLVVGAAMVVLTWLALRGCEAIRGTSSCGGGPGFLLLVATFVVCVLLGSTLLKAFLIPDPGSSSFLAVGIVSVVSLLILIDVMDHWSMLIVIPVISIGAYLASVWVTKTFVDPGES